MVKHDLPMVGYGLAVERIDVAMRQGKRSDGSKLIRDAFDASSILAYLFDVDLGRALDDLRTLYVRRERLARVTP